MSRAGHAAREKGNDVDIRPQNRLSLCAGGGGLDMGLQLAEPQFETRCFVEWDEYPQRTLIAAQESGYFAPAPILRQLRAFVMQSTRHGTWKRLMKSKDKRRLNPIFVEWLMGWPTGHALLDCSEMAFIHWQRQMRFALSELPMAYGPWIWEPIDETEIEQTEMEI